MATLSLELDAGTKARLDTLSERSQQSVFRLAAQAISAFVEAEEWQLDEMLKGIQELDSAQFVGHDEVAKWLGTWGTTDETEAPR